MAPELITICQKMLKEGKTISVGLLKAKAPQKYPLKEIINVVQYCKSQSDLVLQQEVQGNAEAPQTEELEREHLRKKVVELESRLTRVEQLLVNLKCDDLK